ncbi:MAG: hypothetical protein II917_06270 [Synergistaceae bacterium]|nr:hypothetical protein [Synergistaceae bacterium]
MRKVFIASMIFLLLASVSFAAGVKRDPSQSQRISIYDSVKPSPVQRKPERMHVGRSTSNDMSIAVGDVMINPIPNTRTR